MSTLSLADLGPKMRRELGLDASCSCNDARQTMPAAVVATIPCVETVGPSTPESSPDDAPGAAWLRTGLHRLRIPRFTATELARPIQ